MLRLRISYGRLLMVDAATKNAILIAGSTASGKSALALKMAIENDGYIINADSMQVYDVLRVVTARPSLSDEQKAEHFLYGHVSPALSYSTGKWLEDVQNILHRDDLRGRVPVFVGGTGLYYKALLGGLSLMPAIPDDVRSFWRDKMGAEGSVKLYEILEKKDPAIAATLRASDSQRITRALEVIDATGKSLIEWQKPTGHALIDKDSARKIILTPERSVLHQRIADRFALMWESGALEEVKQLLQLELDASLPAVKAIGVREIAAYFSGELSEEEAIELSVIATRQYAKRQTTWFKNQFGDDWERIIP